MKKQFFLVLINLLLTWFGFAQTKYFIVKNNGDTIMGNTKVKGTAFVVTLEDSSKTAIKNDEVAYIKSSTYTGIVVNCKLQLYSDNIDIVSSGNFSNDKVADTVLILKEVFSTPKMNLYYVQDKEKTPYYFYKKPEDPKPIQLLVKYYLHFLQDAELYRNSNGTQFLQLKSYVNQLKIAMEDCIKVKEVDFEALDYREYSLVKIIKQYNKCK